MNKKIIVETIETNVTDECDVFVLGGGIAGVSAALAAARQGKKVLLCEKSFLLGGLATSGLVTVYLPLCDGMGHQVSFGIAEELLKLSVKDWNNGKRGYRDWIQGENPHTEHSPRYEVDFNPHLFAIATEELLTRNGVKILYGTTAVAAIKKGKRIETVIVENKSGRQGIRAKSFVDASGDCDLAFMSGTPTVRFTQGNVLAAWYYFLQSGESHLNMLGFCDVPDEEKKQGATVEQLVDKRFSGLDGEELSEMTVLSHQVMYRDMLKKLGQDKEAIPLTVPTIPQIRMTRRVDGVYTLTGHDEGKHFDSSIGVVSDWKKRGPVYEIPFEALFNGETENLICAGRCVSNDEYMWDILRVIPCCAVTGEAAGTAAALSEDFNNLDIKELQKELVKNGVRLHLANN